MSERLVLLVRHGNAFIREGGSAVSLGYQLVFVIDGRNRPLAVIHHTNYVRVNANPPVELPRNWIAV